MCNKIIINGGYMSTKEKDTASFADFPDVVSVEELGIMLGISTKTAYKLLKQNKIKHFMIGRIYKIPKINILKFIKISP